MQDRFDSPTDATSQSGSIAKDTLLIASKVRDAIRAQNCNTSSDALDGLNAWIHFLIEQATKRARANGRKTIRAHDFMVVT